MSTHNALPAVSRFVTAHNDAGWSIFSSTVPEKPPLMTLPDGLQISFCYATDRFPVQMNEDKDISAYEHMVRHPPGIVIANGSAARLVDFPPGYTSEMHRTISINYNFVIEGEVEMILDSGETRLLKRGDMMVQRGVNHAWRNTSKATWARIAAMALPAESVRAGDKTLAESGIAGIPASG